MKKNSLSTLCACKQATLGDCLTQNCDTARECAAARAAAIPVTQREALDLAITHICASRGRMTGNLDLSEVQGAVKNTLEDVRDLQAIPVTEYDPALCITAGELRAVGVPIPDHIPDCGWVPRSAWKMCADAADHSPPDLQAGILRMNIAVSFTEPFRWIEMQGVQP